jgi:hypothetical protein
MKKYIKPATELTAGINVDSFMITATTDDNGYIPGGGGTGESGAFPGGKSRNRFEKEEEYDPIVQLLIDTEDGNTSDLW